MSVCPPKLSSFGKIRHAFATWCSQLHQETSVEEGEGEGEGERRGGEGEGEAPVRLPLVHSRQQLSAQRSVFAQQLRKRYVMTCVVDDSQIHM